MKKLDIEMVTILGGNFLMGSPEDELGRWGDERQHEVTVPDFIMGKYPVTQRQWRAIAALPKVEHDLKTDPSYFKGDSRPVEQVSWNDAVEFCQRLSRRTGREYRLPSEAEWEYACRAGTTTPFHFRETLLTELANYDSTTPYSQNKGKYRKTTTPVDHFEKANAFGLFDMHGNVWEWCQDHWNGTYEGVPTDGSAWLTNHSNVERVLRGGSWNDPLRYCRSASRLKEHPGHSSNIIGFRVCVGDQND